MKKQINTLQELQAEKQKLRLKMEVTRHAFMRGVEQSQREVRHFVWSKLALPATLAGLTAKGIAYFANGNGVEHAYADAEDAAASASSPHWVEHLAPLLTALFEMLMQTDDEDHD